jgi:hypothetical protein
MHTSALAYLNTLRYYAALTILAFFLKGLDIRDNYNNARAI